MYVEWKKDETLSLLCRSGESAATEKKVNANHSLILTVYTRLKWESAIVYVWGILKSPCVYKNKPRLVLIISFEKIIKIPFFSSPFT